jgi:phage tail sheath protein FI
MANRRSINSPGVEIREIDLSTRVTAPNGTSVLVTGFASQGPTSEIVNVSTVADFEAIYGTPTNAAERYFYYSVRQLFTAGNNATVNVARLPYGAGAGEGFSSKYSALVFPVLPVTTTLSSAAVGSRKSLSAANEYWLTEPTLIELTEDDYDTIKQGGISWATTAGGATPPTFTDINSLSAAGLVILNVAKTTINEKFEGLYLNIADNLNLNPATDFDAAGSIYTITDENNAYSEIPASRLSFELSATASAGYVSVSQDIENIPTYNIAANSGFDDTAILSLFKVRSTPFASNSLELSYVLQEGYAASFYSNRTVQDQNGGPAINNFISTVVNNASPALTVLVNSNISNSTTWLDASGNAAKYVRVLRANSDNAGSAVSLYGEANKLFPLGVYAQTLNTTTNKVIGSITTKLDTILNLAENADVLALDVVADAGLSTIAAAIAVAPLSATGIYDDTVYSGALKTQIDDLSDTTGSYTPGTVVDNWKAVTDMLSDFATYRRKDCVFISDPIRHILVQGENFKVLDSKTKNFSTNVYWPLRNTYNGYNTSYTVAYGNWGKTVDGFSSKSVWVPFSAYAAAIYTRTDAVAYPWGAPAGLNRGAVTGISDLAINPQQKQRDLLSKISINPVVNYPGEGFVIMGQKTLLKAPSAFDRVNVRRLFLYLEKSVLNTTKYFVFEPNTSFTRNRLVNTISPVFDLARNTQGVYDYLIVCNDTNNTADVVDDNTLVVDIYVKPTRTAEFILVNFYATRTNQNFQELLQ